MKRVHTLEDLLHSRLDDIYAANVQLISRLPAAGKRITDSELGEQFAKYLQQTEEQNTRVKAVMNMLEWTPVKGPHHTANGMIRDMNDMLKTNTMKPSVMDAEILSLIQRTIHHHIADFGCVRTWTKLLGYDDAAEHLQACLDEEKEADARLTALAHGSVNQRAAEVHVEMEEK